MKQAEVNRAVAQATGETVERIARLGFSLVEMPRPPRKITRRLRRRNGRLHFAAVAVAKLCSTALKVSCDDGISAVASIDG